MYWKGEMISIEGFFYSRYLKNVDFFFDVCEFVYFGNDNKDCIDGGNSY